MKKIFMLSFCSLNIQIRTLNNQKRTFTVPKKEKIIIPNPKCYIANLYKILGEL